MVLSVPSAPSAVGTVQVGVGTGVGAGVHEAGGGVCGQSVEPEQPQTAAAIISRATAAVNNRAEWRRIDFIVILSSEKDLRAAFRLCGSGSARLL